MEAKTSKAQLEVWEWKEKAYEQIKNMSQEERIKFIRAQTKEMVSRIKRKKAAWSWSACLGLTCNEGQFTVCGLGFTV